VPSTFVPSSPQTKSRHPNHIAPKVRRTPLALAAAVLGSLLGFAAAAQPSAEPPQEPGAEPAAPSASEEVPTVTITIKGIRGSIESSVSKKKNADSIVEAVSAEDLGKLPDNSIAESLARLPGVTAQRVEGRDQVLSIRGLAPKFGVTLLNGREMVSSGDSRSVEYDQYPSELINAGIVYKTPDAALGAQGLSGTVNLTTIRPLDLDGRRIALSLSGEKNSNGAQVDGSSDQGNRLSLSAVGQFLDRTLGLAVGFAHLDSPNQVRYFNPWWWGNTAAFGAPHAGLDGQTSSMQGFETGATSANQVRRGAMAVLEYKPNKSFRTQLDTYASKFDQTVRGSELSVSLGPAVWDGNGIGPLYSDPVTRVLQGDKVLIGGSLGGVDPILISRYRERTDKLSAIGWNTEVKFGDWTTALDLSRSRARRTELVTEATMSAPTLVGFTNFDAEPVSGFSRFPATVDYADPNAVRLRGISAWGDLNGAPSAGSSAPNAVSDDVKTLHLSVHHPLDFGPLSRVYAGVNVTDRLKDTVRTQTIYALTGGSPCVRPNDVCAPIPANLLRTPTALDFAGIPGVISLDTPGLLSSGLYNAGPVNQALTPGRIWQVDERVATLYAKLDLYFDLVVPVRGNIGIQHVRSEQSSLGRLWDAASGSAAPVELGTSYSDTLPSLNLAAELSPDTIVRFGAAKVLARPNMEDLRAGFTASVGTSGADLGRWSGSGGNPLLQPWRADALDLSVEHYLGKRSYVSAAVFEKKLKNSIYVGDFDFDFSGFPNLSGITPVSNIGVLSAPVNGTGGKVKGWEFAVALDAGLAVSALDGLGLIASVSDTDSSLPGTNPRTGRPAPETPLEGLSGRVTSTILYYEKSGWQLRFAERYRSAFVAPVRSTFIENSLVSIEPERIRDLSVGYEFDSGALKGLGLQFQVRNLDDTPYRTSLADDSSTSTPLRLMPTRYVTYGRTYIFGLSYKL
jgi:iron complex outermembrane recepter protein